MLRRRIAVSCLSLGLIATLTVGCSSDDGDDDTAAATTTTTTTGGTGGSAGSGSDVNPSAYVEDPEGVLADTDCWWPTTEIDPAVTITCSTLTVPENWNDPGDRKVVLPVVRLHHRDVAADVVPLVNLHGGPGGDSLSDAPVNASKDVIVKERDLLFYDQRGAGRSTPSLNCPEKEEAVIAALAAADPLDQELAANQKAVEACRARLIGDGIDLDMFNTIQSVNDLEALRRAVGADTWNIRGASYGTRLGLAYARVHPDRIRSLVIDSVYPPQVGGLARSRDGAAEAVGRLVEACEGDPSCSTAYPQLGSILEKAANKLDEGTSITAKVTVDGKERTETFHLTGSDFRSGMFAALYQQALIPMLPSIIDNVSNGDNSILPVYVETAVPLLTEMSEGTFYSVECADSGRLLDGAQAKDFVGDGKYGQYVLNLSYTWCAVWDVAPVDAEFNTVAKPDVPTLVYGGTLDPVTPYADTKAQAEAMPNARLVTVPWGGHGDARWDDCTTSALTGFLADPAAALPACTASIPETPFIVD